MTGIELLEKIKNRNIKNGTKILVYKNNEYVTTLIYDDDLNWNTGSFRARMLWDNNYRFYYHSKDEWEDIEEIEVELRGDCKYRYASKNFISYAFPKEIADTINQLIKNQNYLKERLDKYDRED